MTPSREVRALIPFALVVGVCIAYRPTLVSVMLALASVVAAVVLLRFVDRSAPAPVSVREWWTRHLLRTAAGVPAAAMIGYAIAGVASMLLCSALYAVIYLAAIEWRERRR